MLERKLAHLRRWCKNLANHKMVPHVIQDTPVSGFFSTLHMGKFVIKVPLRAIQKRVLVNLYPVKY